MGGEYEQLYYRWNLGGQAMRFIRNDSIGFLESYFVFAEKKEWREAKKIWI